MTSVGEVTTLPCGSWPTPITSALVAGVAGRPGDVRVDGTDVLWSESRPAEAGRTQIVRLAADGGTADLLPGGVDARTAVHEYGGAAWWVRDGTVWFASWDDQRLYRLARGGTPEPLTPEPAVRRGDRYADGDVSRDGAVLVCVREHHPEGGRGAVDVRNEIVRLAAHAPSEPEVLVSGPDFVAAPRLSPDGTALAWIQWDHPAMPWDETVLMVRDLASGDDIVVAGGPGESVIEPRWHPDGSLWFVSDRTDWWNLYRWSPGADIEAVVPIDAEIGVPAWTFGSARYTWLDDGRSVFARWRDGYDGLAVRAPDGTVTDLELPYSAIAALRRAGADAVVVLAGTPVAEPGVYRVELPPAGEPRVTTLRPPRDLDLDPAYLSVPEPISFRSRDGAGAPRTGYALYYPPVSAAHAVPAGEAPPLLVVIHGGPTGMAAPTLSLGVQYWTSRGFAVVDVNYGGSAGFGRAYREQLRGAWGVVDVADCLAVARELADARRVDGARLCIRGGSAGGYTTLAALARADTPFAAGANHFGVSDLAALAAETHKFESRYLDGLVGPYPEARAVYEERSPISRVDAFSRPLIVLQGAEDEVVPPAQSERIVDALRAKGVPVAYLLFDGEQHGFRRAENIRRALDAELSFYGQVLGFDVPPDEGIEPVLVENL
jgi:dipeptidyl aminopeptidase/acylaminoacyl peptidase